MATATELRTDAAEVHRASPIGKTYSARSERTARRLRLLWESRAILNRATIAGLLLGTILAFVLRPAYQSTAQLMPPDAQSTSGMAMLAALSSRAGDALGSVSSDLLGIKSSGALFVGILGSRTVQDRLISRFDLEKYYKCRLQEEARKQLGRSTSLSEDRKSGIITIVVTDHDPNRAAEIAQAYVDELNRLVAELSTSAAHRERVFLEQRIEDVKKSLNSSSQQFSDFSSKNTAIDIKEQGRAMIDAASSLTGELIATESELSGLKQIYNPNNVHVRSLQARIAELRSKLRDLRGDDGPNPDGDPSAFPTLRRLPAIGVTYADLYRQTKIQEAVLESLTQEYELAKVQEAKETPSVKILDAPNVPERKSFPPRLQIMLMSAFVGLGIGSAWILGKTRWHEADKLSPGRVLADEVLGTVNARMPWAPPNGSRLQAMTHQVWKRFAREESPHR